jgi:hypothetical protein
MAVAAMNAVKGLFGWATPVTQGMDKNPALAVARRDATGIAAARTPQIPLHITPPVRRGPTIGGPIPGQRLTPLPGEPVAPPPPPPAPMWNGVPHPSLVGARNNPGVAAARRGTTGIEAARTPPLPLRITPEVRRGATMGTAPPGQRLTPLRTAFMPPRLAPPPRLAADDRVRERVVIDRAVPPIQIALNVSLPPGTPKDAADQAQRAFAAAAPQFARMINQTLDERQRHLARTTFQPVG